MHNKFWLIVGILAVVIVVPLILFAFTKNKETQETFSPEREIEKFKNDKVVTKTYIGTFPCADCAGIETSLSISHEDVNDSEGTFTLTQKYLGKDADAIISKGNWTTQKEDAVTITLNPENPEKTESYALLDPTHLEKLDNEGNKMTPAGSFVLTLLE